MQARQTQSNLLHRIAGRSAGRRAFTLMEILAALVIMTIVAVIAADAIGDADAGLRAERAAREAAACIRFARSRAMTDGVSYKVRFNVSGKTISVIDSSNTVLAAPIAGGTMVVNLSGKTDVANVTMVPTISGDTTDPYDVTFSPAGGTSNTGTVVFTFGTKTRTLQIPSVGDPTLVGDSRRP